MRQSITQSTKEVEAIVNSIPLSLNDITPNHLLAMKTKVLMPPAGVFLREDLCLRRRWKRGQHLAHDFWEKWRKEFIQVLQLRIKWTKPQRKLQRRDVILLNVPETYWDWHELKKCSLVKMVLEGRSKLLWPPSFLTSKDEESVGFSTLNGLSTNWFLSRQQIRKSPTRSLR